MDKCKVIIFSIGSLFIIMPFKGNKIEVRIRNILINFKHRCEAIAKFIPVYLNAHEKQSQKYQTEKEIWEEEQRQLAIEEARLEKEAK